MSVAAPNLALIAAPCPRGAILPLAPEPLPGMVAHTVSGKMPRELRVGSVLRDGAGEDRFKVVGRALLPSANPHALSCPLLAALAPCSGGELDIATRREGWALAWITLSDKGAAGLRRDESALRKRFAPGSACVTNRGFCCRTSRMTWPLWSWNSLWARATICF